MAQSSGLILFLDDMRHYFHRNNLVINWFAIFIAITGLYYSVSAVAVYVFLNDDSAYILAKLFATSVLIIATFRSNLLKTNLFHSDLMSGAVLICTLSVLVLSANQIAVFHSAKVESLTFHVFNNLLTAVFEEVLYRVVLFLGMIQFFNSPGLRFWKVTALTSFIFAALHFMNIIRLDFNIYTAFTQVVFAFGFGFLAKVFNIIFKNVENLNAYIGRELVLAVRDKILRLST